MNIIQAAQAMQAGHKVRRQKWKDEWPPMSLYLGFSFDIIYDDYHIDSAVFGAEEMLAEDWEVVDERRP